MKGFIFLLFLLMIPAAWLWYKKMKNQTKNQAVVATRPPLIETLSVTQWDASNSDFLIPPPTQTGWTVAALHIWILREDGEHKNCTYDVFTNNLNTGKFESILKDVVVITQATQQMRHLLIPIEITKKDIGPNGVFLVTKNGADDMTTIATTLQLTNQLAARG
jgi:hypothetical protein